MSNFLEALKEYFKNTSKEKILEDWNKSEKSDNIEPTIEEFIQNMDKNIKKNGNI